MQLRFAAATDVGRERDHNEDSYAVEPSLRLFVVADGMGGHAAGEVASRLAVKHIVEYLTVHRGVIDDYAQGRASRTTVMQALREAVENACRVIYEHAEQNPEARGMGTTTSALLIAGTDDAPTAFLAHVGDSRIYMFRGGQTHQLSEDHAVKHELIRRGKVARDNFAESPYSKFEDSVTRALGAHPTVQVDTMSVAIEAGDHFLLCSDGLYAYLDRAKLSALLDTTDNADLPDALVALANNGGGHDNITCVSVLVGESEQLTHDIADADVVAGAKATLLGQILSSAQLWQLIGMGDAVRVSAGEVVYGVGKPSECVYLVLSGAVTVQLGSAPPLLLSEGRWFGSGALFDEDRREDEARCQRDALLLRIHRDDFLEESERHGPLAARLLWSIGQDLREQLATATR